MWSEGQVRLWCDRVLHDVAYLDATGTIVGNYNGKRSLYYALVVQHPTIPQVGCSHFMHIVHKNLSSIPRLK